MSDAKMNQVMVACELSDGETFLPPPGWMPSASDDEVELTPTPPPAHPPPSPSSLSSSSSSSSSSSPSSCLPRPPPPSYSPPPALPPVISFSPPPAPPPASPPPFPPPSIPPLTLSASQARCILEYTSHFAAGLHEGLSSNKKPVRNDVRAVNLSLLSSKHLSRLLQGYDPFDLAWPERRRQKDRPQSKKMLQCQRHCRRFLNMSEKKQRDVLARLHLFLYKKEEENKVPSTVESSSSSSDSDTSSSSSSSSSSASSSPPLSDAEEYSPEIVADLDIEPELKRVGIQHIDDDVIAFIAEDLPCSVLSHELNTKLFCFNFENARFKPKRAKAFNGTNSLQSLLVKSCGKVVFAPDEIDLMSSFSYAWLLEHAKDDDMGQFQARADLLLSPFDSRWPHPLPWCVNAYTCKVVRNGERFSDMNVDTIEGNSVISYALCKRLNIPGLPDIKDFSQNDPCLIPAFQIRALIRVNAADVSRKCQKYLNSVALVKGVVHVVMSNDLFIHVPLSNLKAVQRNVSQEDARRMSLWVASLKSTEKKMGLPWLTSQVAAALHARINILEHASPERREAEDEFSKFLNECREATGSSLPFRAFDLPMVDQSESSNNLSHAVPMNKRQRTADAWIERRVPGNIIHHRTNSALTEDDETPISELTKPEMEVNSNCLLHGTADAVQRGINSLHSVKRSIVYKGRLHIPGPAGTVTCVPDPWRGTLHELADGKCYIIKDGKAMVGDQVAIWRCPCQVATDFEVWDAVPIPDEILKHFAIHQNCIIFSCKGRGVSCMAGGDSDGDIVMFSFNKRFARILKLTIAASELDIDGINDWLTSQLNKLREKREKKIPPREKMHGSAQERFQQFIAWNHSTKTPKVRGICCALAEQFQYFANVLHSDDPLQVHRAFVCGLAAHRAMDCPKKEDASDVIALCKLLLQRSNVPKNTPRSSKYAAETWTKCTIQPIPPGKDGWRPFKEEIMKSLQTFYNTDKKVPLGRVWFHPSRIVLGFEAGILVGEHLVNRPHFVRYQDRSVWRTQLEELAYHIQGRFKGIFETANLDLIRETLHEDVFEHMHRLAPEVGSDRERKAPKRKPTTELGSLLKLCSF
jgi:hypothetical protein